MASAIIHEEFFVYEHSWLSAGAAPFDIVKDILGQGLYLDQVIIINDVAGGAGEPLWFFAWNDINPVITHTPPTLVLPSPDPDAPPSDLGHRPWTFGKTGLYFPAGMSFTFNAARDGSDTTNVAADCKVRLQGRLIE